MSLFLQTLLLRGILFRQQEHRQEHMNPGPQRRAVKAVLKTASRFAGARELKNSVCDLHSALRAARVVQSDIEEFHMKRILTQYVVCALAVALMVPLAQSQPAGLQAAFAKDAGTLSDKFTGLARVMSGKYDWKPAQGVRSVADVFNLIVKENGLLAGVLSGTPNTGAQPVSITDPEKMQEALKASYLNLQKVITALSDNDLQAPVKLFGRDMTKQSALMLILEDQHEHLGQSIAYARSNGVVPPWSK
jgi:uncharacterized damage-inducible protein DinB